MPAEIYNVVHEKLVSTQQPPRYSKVTMTLGDILEGEFFNEYIKNGTVDCSVVPLVGICADIGAR